MEFLYNHKKIEQPTRKVILIIEDNNLILENLTECFEIEGYKIISAHNGASGVELAKESIPDLIVCDVLMPDMNGYEVLRLVLENIKTHEIPFIFSTSNAERVDKQEALKLGADDYIIKPFDPAVLLQMANTWINSGTKRHFYIGNQRF